MHSKKMRRWKDVVSNTEGLTFWCPGCENYHSISTLGEKAWTWNGSLELAVISPSILVTYGAIPEAEEEFKEWRTERRCHSFIGTNGAPPGHIIFLDDCTHKLKGQTMLLPDIPVYE